MMSNVKREREKKVTYIVSYTIGAMVVVSTSLSSGAV